MVAAAQYVRMSTEHQRYSVEAQATANAAYALEHGYSIVQTYVDAGISGLTLRGREGLKSLLGDVLGGAPGFDIVLVYDVSRWGRFQDPDQAGHYEFLCRQAGVRIEYTSEAFANDDSLATTLVKHLKRAMAAEYSRELSVKVSRAKQGLARKGYWQGGKPVYGFRRRIVNLDGSLGLVLQAGERKALQGCRVVLARGPEHEVAVVRRIFSEFVVHGLSVASIVRRLEAEGVSGARGGPWTYSRVLRLLQDEKYAGVVVTGRWRMNFRKARRTETCEQVRLPGACPALVSAGYYELAQQNLRRRPQWPSDAALLKRLRELWRRHGRLSGRIINDDPDTYCVSVYHARFGGLMHAYERIGYSPSNHQWAAQIARLRQTRPTYVPPIAPYSEEDLLQGLRDLLRRYGRLTSNLINMSSELPSSSTYRMRFGSLQSAYARVGYQPGPAQLRRFRANLGQQRAHRTPARQG